MGLTGTILECETFVFSKPPFRERAVKDYIDNPPGMPILSPMWCPFGRLQGLIHSNMQPEDVERRLGDGVVHLKFAMVLGQIESSKNGLFMFVHLASAESRLTGATKQMLNPLD